MAPPASGAHTHVHAPHTRYGLMPALLFVYGHGQALCLLVAAILVFYTLSKKIAKAHPWGHVIVIKFWSTYAVSASSRVNCVPEHTHFRLVEILALTGIYVFSFDSLLAL